MKCADCGYYWQEDGEKYPHCPYFCHRDKEDKGDYGLCLMQEMEGCSPVNECEAFDGVDEEEFEV